MRLPSPRFLIGLVLVLAVCVGVAFCGHPAAVGRLQRTGGQRATVTCVGGSEKSELMADPEVKRILQDKYGVTVVFHPLGSYDQVQLSTDELKQRKLDCLWPSSASAQSVFESQHAGAFDGVPGGDRAAVPRGASTPGRRGPRPSWPSGIVEKRAERYYIVDMKSLLLEYVLKNRKWEALGTKGFARPDPWPAPTRPGPTAASPSPSSSSTSSRPTTSSRRPTPAQAKAALPQIRALYDAQGLAGGAAPTSASGSG